MDTLSIKNIKASCRIGLGEQERAEPHEVLVSVELDVGDKNAFESDDIADAVDYAKLVAALREKVAANERKLIEALAEDLAKWVVKAFDARYAQIKVEKPGVLEGVESVSVTVALNRSKRNKIGFLCSGLDAASDDDEDDGDGDGDDAAGGGLDTLGKIDGRWE